MKTVRTAMTALLAPLVSVGAVACSSTTNNAIPPHRSHPTVATTAAPARPTAAVDALVAVGDSGARMHVTCSGSGTSTVVLIAGFGDAGESWGAVSPVVSEEARVCSFSRFGLGTSDAPPADQTFATQADALHDALGASGEPGPYVVVGHSFGGPEAVSFAARFAGEVTGLVLVDASPTDWPAALCGVPDDGSAMATTFHDTCESVTHADQNPERLDGVAAFAGVRAVRSLGDLPMTVLTRAVISNPGLASGVEGQLATAWLDGQARWAALSTASHVTPIEDTGHLIQIDQPAIVIDAVRSMLATDAAGA